MTLFEAIQEGDAKQAAQLIEADPSLAASRSPEGVSALLFALYMQKPEIAGVIRGALAGMDIFEAAALGEVETVAALLADDPGLARARSADGFTALHLACFFGQEEAVRRLLQAGAEANLPAVNPMQVHPIHSAAAVGSVPIARLLLEAGATADAAQHGGWTALHSAAKHGNRPLVELLLEHGADPHNPAEDGTTAIAFAEAEGHHQIAELLKGRAEG